MIMNLHPGSNSSEVVSRSASDTDFHPLFVGSLHLMLNPSRSSRVTVYCPFANLTSSPFSFNISVGRSYYTGLESVCGWWWLRNDQSTRHEGSYWISISCQLITTYKLCDITLLIDYDRREIDVYTYNLFHKCKSTIRPETHKRCYVCGWTSPYIKVSSSVVVDVQVTVMFWSSSITLGVISMLRFLGGTENLKSKIDLEKYCYFMQYLHLIPFPNIELS